MSDYRAEVLIIDDDLDILNSMQQLLEMEGYRVSKASNGLEGLEYFRKSLGSPDLILLDLMMPVMNGKEFVINFNDEFPAKNSIPIVLFTAAGEAKHRDISCSLEIKKPTEVDDLLKIVAQFTKT